MSENGGCIKVIRNMLRKKNISNDMRRTDLNRCFTLVDLTYLAISGMVGSGLYVLSGTVTRNIAGPSIVIAYVLAAIAAILSALCYAEFAARVPVAGSAYQFTYLSVGEFWAFLVGWNVALEHSIYVAAIAKTSSGYLDGLFGNVIRKYMTTHAPMPGGFVASYPDFLAAGLILFFTLVLISGVKLSSKVNIAIATINIAVITFIIVTGIYLAKWDNWFNVKGGFFPFGWSGMITGATTLVYSYVGYEVVASATEEAINAGRDIPLSLLISITVVVISFVGASAALTVMVPWYEVSVTTPYPTAYASRGWFWAKYVVSIGALAAMVTCLLSVLFVIPRYLLAMARDGLLWNFFTILHSKTQVPYVSSLIVAVVSSLMAILFSLTTLVEFIAIGQLMACTFVAICLVKLRYIPNQISSYERADECAVVGDAQKEDTLLKELHTGDSLRARRTEQENSTEKSMTSTTELNSKSDLISPQSNDVSSSSSNSCNKEESFLLHSHFGTVKKSVLYSSAGFLFQWTTGWEAGSVPFYSLLIAVFSSTIAIAMLLFGSAHITSWWFITILSISIIVALFCVCFICAFIQDDTIKTFQVPLVPFIPFISIVINIALMLKLKSLTWARLAVWMIAGVIVYFGYGYRHSKARKESEMNE